MLTLGAGTLPFGAMATSERIPVAVVDDHVMVRDGFRQGVESDGRYEVVIMAGNGEDYIRQSKAKRVVIALVDLYMPRMDGWATLAWIRDHQPEVRMAAISVDMGLEGRSRALKAGAGALLYKGVDRSELLLALDDLKERRFHYNDLMKEQVTGTRPTGLQTAAPSSAVLVGAAAGHDVKMKEGVKRLARLSPRELEVFRWRLHHPKLDYDQIGLRMGVERCTVESHGKGIRRKTGLKDREDIVLFTVEHGLYTALHPITGKGL
jgi:DNA-binding NarL/FixJ family response regulator